MKLKDTANPYFSATGLSDKSLPMASFLIVNTEGKLYNTIANLQWEHSQRKQCNWPFHRHGSFTDDRLINSQSKEITALRNLEI